MVITRLLDVWRAREIGEFALQCLDELHDEGTPTREDEVRTISAAILARWDALELGEDA